MAYYGYKPAEQAIQIGDNTIVSADIADGSIVNADLNSSAAIAMSKTQLVAGTGLTLSTNTLNVDAAQTGITSVGTIGTGVWNGTAVASAYLDADTAHLTTTQTFSGAKTFSADVTLSGAKLLVAASAQGIFGAADGDTGIRWEGSNVLAIDTGGSERVTIDASGNSTFAGDVKLSSAGDNIFTIESTDNNSCKIELIRTDTSYGDWQIMNNGGELYFTTVNNSSFSGATSAFKINGSNNATFAGNVAIGGMNPSDYSSSANNLVVGTGTGQEGITILGGDNAESNIFFADGTDSAGKALPGYVNYKHDTNMMRFQTNGAVRLTIANDGHVDMAQKLTIGSDFRQTYGDAQFYSTCSFGGGVTVNNAGSTTPAYVKVENTGSTGYTGADFRLLTHTSTLRGAGIYTHNTAADDEWFVGQYYGNWGKWAICYEGRADFNESVAESPHELLYVNQSGEAYNDGNTWGSTSDERIKNSIVDANSQWDDIKALKIKNYKKDKDGKDAPVHIGVIAQDLEASGMNGLVNEALADEAQVKMYDRLEEGDSIKTVKYSILYMKAIKALQEAMIRIEALENA